MPRPERPKTRLEKANRRAAGRRALALAHQREGNEDFDVSWGWAEGAPRTGFTAVLRLKDEARSLPWSLPPLLRAVRTS